MTDNDDLKRRERAVKRELSKRRAMTPTERQIAAARGHSGRAQEPDYEDDRSKWTTSERQAFAARGVRPQRHDD